jgi:hypothetical protein
MKKAARQAEKDQRASTVANGGTGVDETIDAAVLDIKAEKELTPGADTTMS